MLLEFVGFKIYNLYDYMMYFSQLNSQG